MGNKFTIVTAIKRVLEKNIKGMTASEVYYEIIHENLYNFGAKNPIGVVNGEIRRHCIDLAFPTASPVKYFRICGHEGNKNKYTLVDTATKAMKSHNSINEDITEVLPEEKIDSALNEHYSQIRQQLLEHIMDNLPDFFEQLVVDLLLKMGYGYDNQSGIVTGRSHDSGIDGIIREDKLGLDLIYIQAKRYKPGDNVSRKELQAFVGAMGNTQKGVFITTSNYTKEAKEFSEKQQQKNIKLIDGEMLTEFMIRYEIGVESVKCFNVYKIDVDYFNE